MKDYLLSSLLRAAVSNGKSFGLTPSDVRSGSRSEFGEVAVEFTVRAKLFRSLCGRRSLACKKILYVAVWRE